mmetsp:Transcript_814/g.1874  ORF Transcript_814/g.1874 Transcript_814/m.1874 type:complete len:298 (-) Transcript_814:698-1591(-)
MFQFQAHISTFAPSQGEVAHAHMSRVFFIARSSVATHTFYLEVDNTQSRSVCPCCWFAVCPCSCVPICGLPFAKAEGASNRVSSNDLGHELVSRRVIDAHYDQFAIWPPGLLRNYPLGHMHAAHDAVSSFKWLHSRLVQFGIVLRVLERRTAIARVLLGRDQLRVCRQDPTSAHASEVSEYEPWVMVSPMATTASDVRSKQSTNATATFVQRESRHLGGKVVCAGASSSSRAASAASSASSLVASAASSRLPCLLRVCSARLCRCSTTYSEKGTMKSVNATKMSEVKLTNCERMLGM